MIKRSYNIQVITPIFGGGVNAGENDPATPIRPSSIRGHLRFWWRATRGAARCSTVAELRQREGEIWGTTDNPSPVWIEIPTAHHDASMACACYKWNEEAQRGKGDHKLYWCQQFDRSSLPYVLFPFQGKKPRLRRNGEDPEVFPSKIFSSAQFTLTVHISEPERMVHYCSIFNKQRNGKGLPLLKKDDTNIEMDVEASIWAWVNFGGIGARTRRGCGALYCLDPNDICPPSCQDFKMWLNERVSRYGLTMSLNSREDAALKGPSSTKPPLFPPRNWATLGKIFIKKSNILGKNAISSWKECIDVMKDLRQGIKGRDNGASRHPGRSRWPEAESIRNLVIVQRGLTSRPSTMHPEDKRIPGIAFPRAEFGMPIIFELRKDYINRIANIKPTLQPNKDHDRMASPLILRPIKFGDGSLSSMILRLDTPPLLSAYLKPGDQDLVSSYPIPSTEIKLENYSDSPFTDPCKPSFASALDVFMSFAQDRGFKEVFP